MKGASIENIFDKSKTEEGGDKVKFCEVLIKRRVCNSSWVVELSCGVRGDMISSAAPTFSLIQI